MKEGWEAPRRPWRLAVAGALATGVAIPDGSVWSAGQIHPNTRSLQPRKRRVLSLGTPSARGVLQSQAQICCSREAVGCLRDPVAHSSCIVPAMTSETSCMQLQDVWRTRICT